MKSSGDKGPLPVYDKSLFGEGGYESVRPASISDAHYAAIGKLVDAWADLEFEVDLAIWKLQGVEQALGACVTAQLVSILPKLDALRSLANRLGLGETIDKKLKRFHGDIGPLVSERNRRVHDKRVVFFSSDIRGEVCRFEVSAKSTLKWGPALERIDELTELFRRIRWKIQEFEKIKEEISAAYASLRQKSPAPQSHIAPPMARKPIPPKTRKRRNAPTRSSGE